MVPAGDVGRFAAFVAPQGRGPGIIEQRTLARFIETGQLDRHLRRLRRRLQDRQSAVLDALDRYAAGRLLAAPVPAGRHVVARIVDPDVDPARLIDRAALGGVAVEIAGKDAVLIGFGGSDPERLTDGVRRLTRALEASRSSQPRERRSTSAGWPTAGPIGLAGVGRDGTRRHQP